jgi:hypothetical protein
MLSMRTDLSTKFGADCRRYLPAPVEANLRSLEERLQALTEVFDVETLDIIIRRHRPVPTL